VAVFNKTQLRTGKFEQNNEVANDAYSRLIKVTHKGSLHNYWTLFYFICASGEKKRPGKKKNHQNIFVWGYILKPKWGLFQN